MTANILPATGEPPFATINYPVEHFIAAANPPKSEGSFLGAVARSPYASVSNAFDFYRNLQNPEFEAEHKSHTMSAYGSRLIAGTLMYISLFWLEARIAKVPILGFFFKLFYFVLLDLPKVYGVLSAIYWHAHGENSVTLSAIMPKDVYIWSKRLSIFVVSLLPMWLFDYPVSPFYHLFWINKAIAEPIEIVCKLITGSGRLLAKPGAQKLKENFENPWDHVVSDQAAPFSVQVAKQSDLKVPPSVSLGPSTVLRDIPRPFIIRSEVATGKSSLFPYALLNRHAYARPEIKDKLNAGGRIVLCFPRKLLVEKWNSPLENDLQPVQRLRKNVRISPNSRILLGTDGHMLNRLAANEFTDNDIFLLDEFHELNGQKVALFQELLLAKRTVMLLSATPVAIPGTEVGFMDAGIPRRFAPDIYPYPDSMSVVDVLRQFGTKWIEKGNLKHRVLIKCTHVIGRNQANETLEALQYDQWRCHLLTGDTAHLPIPDEAQLVIATDVINTGLSLPGFKLMITDGHMHAVDQGEHSLRWTDIATQHQSDGRVARYGPGDVVLRPVSAGTGKKPQAYPSMNYLKYWMNAQKHDLPQLIHHNLTAKTPAIKKDFEFFDFIPYLAVSKKIPEAVRPHVAGFHFMINAGLTVTAAKSAYNNLVHGRNKLEELELIEHVYKQIKTAVPFEAILSATTVPEGVFYLTSRRTEKTMMPLSTAYNWPQLTPLDGVAPVDQFFAFAPTQPVVPYKGRLTPIEDTDSKVDLSLLDPKRTIAESTLDIFDQTRRALESQLQDAKLNILRVASASIPSKSSSPHALKKRKREFERSIDRIMGGVTALHRDIARQAIRRECMDENTPSDIYYTTDVKTGQQHVISQEEHCRYCNNDQVHIHPGYRNFDADLATNPSVIFEDASWITSDSFMFVYQPLARLTYDDITQDNETDNFLDFDPVPSTSYLFKNLAGTDDSLGYIMCPHSEVAAIGESGPIDSTPCMPCGCRPGTDDRHVINPDMRVLRRGSRWTAKKAAGPGTHNMPAPQPTSLPNVGSSSLNPNAPVFVPRQVQAQVAAQALLVPPQVTRQVFRFGNITPPLQPMAVPFSRQTTLVPPSS